MQPGLVSVIICVFNAGSYLRPAVESILQQTYHELEVIVVDDGSTDGCIGTLHDLRDERLRIIRQENRGKPAALNAGLAEARGEFYAVQDADDISDPRRIAMQMRALRSEPTVAGVFCGYDLLLDDRRIAPRMAPRDIDTCREDVAKMRMPGHDPTAMYRMSMVRALQYDETLPIVEGYDYVLRVGERHDMMVIGDCLYSYRVHWNTVTKSDPSKRCRLLRRAVGKVFERRGIPYTDHDLPRLPRPGRIRNRERDNDLVSHFMVSVVDLRHAGDTVRAARTAARCATLHPLDPYYYKPLAYALGPIGLIDRYRAWRDK